MHVGGRGIPAGVAVLQRLRADGAALLQSKIGVPCLGQRAGAGEAGPGTHAGKAADLGGAVGILAAHLADALKLKQTAVAVDKQVFHLLHSQLIQQGIPLRVIEVSAQLEAEVGGLAVVLNLQAVVGTGGDGLVGLIDVAVCHVSGVEVQCLDVVGHGTAGSVGLGEGACKISTGHISNVLLGIAAVKAYAVNGIAAGELVGNRFAGNRILGILHTCGQAASNRCVGIIVHIVGIMAHGKDVVACIQFITGKAVVVGIICVIAGHIRNGHSQGNFFALAGGQFLRLGERTQFDAGFFNLTRGVRGGVIQLNNILACAVTGIGNRNFYGHAAIFCQRTAIGGSIGNFPIKASVRQAVTERILHNAIVANAIFVAYIVPIALSISRFIPLIADVDTLGIVYIRNLLISIRGIQVAGGRTVCWVEAISIGISTYTFHASIGIAGSSGQVISPGICRAAAGLFVAPQHFRHCSCTFGTRQTNQQAGINAGNRFDLAQFHNVGRVDKNNHMGIISANIVQQVFFLGGQFQHCAGIVNNNVTALFGALVLLFGRIVAFACQATNNNDCCIRVVLGVVKHRLRVIGLVVNIRLIQAARLFRPTVQCTGVFTACLEILVHIGQFCIVLNTISGQCCQQVRINSGHTAGTRAAAQPCSGSPAEHINFLGICVQRQGVIVVLEQNRAFCFNISGKSFRFRFRVRNLGFSIVSTGRTDETINDCRHR